MFWLALAALLCATVTDVRRREIPHWIPILLCVAAVLAKLAGWHPVSWTGILAGALTAFFVGALLFRLQVLGGGDVKLFAGLGAVLGIGALVPFVLATSICGGIYALFAMRRGETEIAYAPVMLAGLLSLVPLLWIGNP